MQKNANPPSFKQLEELESLLKVAFRAPRKTILNNLSKAYPRQKLMEALESLNLAVSKRPHEIDTLDYHRLLKIL